MVFLVLVFAILAITLSYTKAYRVNSMIVDSVEKFEGFNDFAKKDVIRILSGIGYHADPGFNAEKSCPKYTDNRELQSNNLKNGERFPLYPLCVYHIKTDDEYYRYGVLSYAYIELPIIGKLIKFQVYSETRDIYYFK